MNISLADQKAVVTGAARGIGRSIVQALIEAGCHVWAIDRDESALKKLRDSNPDSITIEALDIADYSDLQALAERTGAIDHLVCAAAVGSGKGGFPFWNLEPSDWQKVLDITLMGTVNTLHAFTPNLLSGEYKDRKSVLLLASVAGQIGSQTDPPYSAAKAAVINFAQCAAKDFATHKIRVNALSPGMVKTDLNRTVFESLPESKTETYEEWARKKIAGIAPLSRWQEAEEFGAMAVFLASDFGKNITGQTINIDGGQVMHS